MSTYGFVDGAALQQFVSTELKDIFPRESVKPNYSRLASMFKCDRIFYYDAYPSKKDDEKDEDFQKKQEERDLFLRALNRLDKFHVRTGTTRHRKKQGLEQKGVDIQLSLDAYQHAVRGNIEHVILILSDLDFYPLLEALTQTRVTTELRYFRKKTSEMLIEAADYARPFALRDLACWCDDPYSRRLGISFKGDKLILSNLQEIMRGTLGDGNVAIYENTNGEYLIDCDCRTDLVCCRNVKVGIDYLEIEEGTSAEFLQLPNWKT